MHAFPGSDAGRAGRAIRRHWIWDPICNPAPAKQTAVETDPNLLVTDTLEARTLALSARIVGGDGGRGGGGTLCVISGSAGSRDLDGDSWTVATDVPNGAYARDGAAPRRAIGSAVASVSAPSCPRARGAAYVLPPLLRQSRRHSPSRMLVRGPSLLIEDIERLCAEYPAGSCRTGARQAPRARRARARAGARAAL